MTDSGSDLFAWARATDPETSHAAARSIESALPDLEAKVLAALRDAGDRGLTVDELVMLLGLEKVTVSPRLRPLCDKGLVSPATDGEKPVKRPGKSGRSQIVWRAKTA